MLRAGEMHQSYMALRPECEMVTAVDGRFAPYLFNTLASLHARFPTHPTVHVFDLGMTASQLRELGRVSWIRISRVKPFVRHWKANWSWKPHILRMVDARYTMYFDSANLVFYRPLELWFLALARSGYFVIANGQTMGDVTPSNYWQEFGLKATTFASRPTFGAGLFGIDNGSIARQAIEEAAKYTEQGWTLGCSATETNPHYDRSVVRDCSCFRADQTLLNLTMRKRFGEGLLVRCEAQYYRLGSSSARRGQYLWYARRVPSSLSYFWDPLATRNYDFWRNRVATFAEVQLRAFARSVLNTRQR